MQYLEFFQSLWFYVFLFLSLITHTAYAIGHYGDGTKKAQLLRNSTIAGWIIYILTFIFVGVYGGIALIVLSFLVIRHIGSFLAISLMRLLRRLV